MPSSMLFIDITMNSWTLFCALGIFCALLKLLQLWSLGSLSGWLLCPFNMLLLYDFRLPNFDIRRNGLWVATISKVWFLTKAVFHPHLPPWGHLAMTRHIFGCHNCQTSYSAQHSSIQHFSKMSIVLRLNKWSISVFS